MTVLTGPIIIDGSLTVSGGISPRRARSEISQENLSRYPRRLSDLYCWDAPSDRLPDLSADDNLGLEPGTFGTNQVSVQTYDMASQGAKTLYFGDEFSLPPEYVAGESVQIQLSAGMLTTLADVSCTVDVECRKVGRDNTVGSDLCTTAAQSINSLSFSNKTFEITGTLLSPGDRLEVRVAIAINDASNVTVVKACIAAYDFLLDIKG